jgi:hypothetical protein
VVFGTNSDLDFRLSLDERRQETTAGSPRDFEGPSPESQTRRNLAAIPSFLANYATCVST